MKSKIKLLSIVMAGLMLFVATEAMAQEGYICDLVTLSQNGTSPTPYKIKFVGVTPCTLATCGTDPVTLLPRTGFLWDYKVINSPGSITQLSILAPVCSEDLGLFVLSGGSVFAPGLGDTTTIYGAGDFQDQVARLALNSSSDYVLGVSREAGQAPTSMQIRVSRTNYYCPAIPGPDCPRAPTVPVLREKKVLIDGMYAKFIIDSNNCAQEAHACDSTYTYCVPLKSVTLTATASDGVSEIVREVSDLDGNQMCAWGRLLVGNNTCTYVPKNQAASDFWRVGDTCPCTVSTQCYPPKTCQSGRCKCPVGSPNPSLPTCGL